MEIAFLASLAIVFFTYLGYPLLMAAAAASRPIGVGISPHFPTIDVLLVVHDAETEVSKKIENLLSLEYPKGLLRINVVCDGCRDSTESIARQYASPFVRVFSHAARRGKSSCIGSTLPYLDAELVLFTDVRQRIASDAARALAAVFADPRIGAASGELVLESAQGYGAGIDAYWRYEKMIRRFESASGSLVGVTGALYAARRNAVTSIPAGIILDDMWVPLSIAAAGYRVIFVPLAIAVDRSPDDPALEERRKRRTLAGNYQLLHLWPALALPGAHPLAWRLWGHKWLRLLAPWLLALALMLNASLATTSVAYAALLAAQLAGYAMALIGRISPPSRSFLPVRTASAFLSLNLSAALALIDYVAKRDIHLWSATRASGAVRDGSKRDTP